MIHERPGESPAFLFVAAVCDRRKLSKWLICLTYLGARPPWHLTRYSYSGNYHLRERRFGIAQSEKNLAAKCRMDFRCSFDFDRISIASSINRIFPVVAHQLLAL
jgi:hypothetical protein